MKKTSEKMKEKEKHENDTKKLNDALKYLLIKKKLLIFLLCDRELATKYSLSS